MTKPADNPREGHGGRLLVILLIAAALAMSTLILVVNRPALRPPALPDPGGNQTGVDDK